MSLAPPHTSATGAIAFTATLELGGRTATGIEVPQDVVERLGAGKRPPVRVTLDDGTNRKTHETRRRRIAKAVANLREERT